MVDMSDSPNVEVGSIPDEFGETSRISSKKSLVMEDLAEH